MDIKQPDVGTSYPRGKYNISSILVATRAPSMVTSQRLKNGRLSAFFPPNFFYVRVVREGRTTMECSFTGEKMAIGVN